MDVGDREARSRRLEIEWVDDQPAQQSGDVNDQKRPTRRWSTIRWHWWYLIIALVAVAGVVIAIRPEPTRQTSASASSASSAARLGPVGSVSIVPAGQPLMDGAAPSWELFARGPGVVVRMQLGLGRVTTTSIPQVTSSGDVSFIAGTDRVIIRAQEPAPGYIVPNGSSAVVATGPFAQGTVVLPGPDQQHVWIQAFASNGAGSTMKLVGIDGSATTSAIGVPARAGTPRADGGGYVLFPGLDGIFDARPDLIQRVTNGPLLAVGPTSWLTEECDDHFICGLTTIDRVTGARHPVNAGTGMYDLSGGLISPDGGTAALVQVAGNGVASIHLLDLFTGVDTDTKQPVDLQSSAEGRFVWSPDSRWLFALSASGVPEAIYRATPSRIEVIGTPSLPVPITQLAFAMAVT